MTPEERDQDEKTTKLILEWREANAREKANKKRIEKEKKAAEMRAKKQQRATMERWLRGNTEKRMTPKDTWLGLEEIGTLFGEAPEAPTPAPSRRSVPKRPPTLESIRKRKRKEVKDKAKTLTPLSDIMRGFSTPIQPKNGATEETGTPNVSVIPVGDWPEGEDEEDSWDRQMSMALTLETAGDLSSTVIVYLKLTKYP